LSLLEIRNSLNFGIHRGEITSEQRDAVLSEIDAQIEKGFFRLVDASQSSIYSKAQELSDKHRPATATRSLPGFENFKARSPDFRFLKIDGLAHAVADDEAETVSTPAWALHCYGFRE